MRWSESKFFAAILLFVAFFGAVSMQSLATVSDGFDYPVGIPNALGWQVKQDFYDWNPNYNKHHLGEDWNWGSGYADLGLPVHAVANGRVTYIDNPGPGWNGVIIINHGPMSGPGFLVPGGQWVSEVASMYAHLDPGYLNDWVSFGDYVRRGQQIGIIGSPAAGSTAPHLHFELRTNTYLGDFINNGVGPGYSVNPTTLSYYTDPSDFIDLNRPGPVPLVGNWDGDGHDEIGAFEPGRTGAVPTPPMFGLDGSLIEFGQAGDYPLIGDWDRDGRDNIGLFRVLDDHAYFYLDLDNNGGTADKSIFFAYPQDIPLVGDWDGDGDDDIGGYDPSTSTFYLYTLDLPASAATSYRNVAYGQSGDCPIVGDWDGDGDDDIGVARSTPTTYAFYLDVALTGGQHELGPFDYGDVGDIPLTGDLDGRAYDRVGIHRPLTGMTIFSEFPPASAVGNPVQFPDPNLEQAIREAINKPTGDIYDSDLAGLTQLDASNRGILDLAGLEHVVNLQELYLWNNMVSEISPLVSLSKLRKLQLDHNQIVSISPLRDLTNLEWLNLENNQINDISSLQGLTKLLFLELWRNQISNVAPIANLKNLQELSLGGNQIGNISPLISLTHLQKLWLAWNQISDISPLIAIRSVDYVDLRYNYLDLIAGSDDMQNIQALINRGVDVEYEPQNTDTPSGRVGLVSVTLPCGTVLQRGTQVPFEVTLDYELQGQQGGLVGAELGLSTGEGVRIGSYKEVLMGSGTVTIAGTVDVDLLYEVIQNDTAWLAISIGYRTSPSNVHLLQWESLTNCSYPISADEAPPWRRFIQPGDILYDPCALHGIGHVGIYIGNGKTVDPRGDGLVHDITTWDWDARPAAQILRVDCPDSSPNCAQAAADWASDLVDQIKQAPNRAYCYQCPLPSGYSYVCGGLPGEPGEGTYCTSSCTKNASQQEDDWYCSELVWAAYFNQKVNIENDRDEGTTWWITHSWEELEYIDPIRPHEICDDNYDVYPVSGHDHGELIVFTGRQCGCETNVEIRVDCPVDLLITDPDGLTIDKDSSEISDAIYWVDDLDGDGSLDVVVILKRKEGTYQIHVVPRPEAEPTDSYTLVFEDYGARHVATLADEIWVKDIADEPYTITVERDTSLPSESTHTYGSGAGWYMVSVPLNGGTAAEIFGTTIYRWNPATEQYDIASTVEPSKGYWARLPANKVVKMIGEEVTTDVTIDISTVGWHQISSPWRYHKTAVLVTNGTETKLWLDAVQAGWVLDYLYHTNPGYSSDQVPPAIHPWYGYSAKALVPGLSLKLSYACGTPLGSTPATVAESPALRATALPKDLPPPPPYLLVSLSEGSLAFSNFPNPITDVATTTFAVAGPMSAFVNAVKVQIFDLAGRLVYEREEAGRSFDWHTDNQLGETLANGVYLYKIYALVGGEWEESEVKKLVILR